MKAKRARNLQISSCIGSMIWQSEAEAAIRLSLASRLVSHLTDNQDYKKVGDEARSSFLFIRLKVDTVVWLTHKDNDAKDQGHQDGGQDPDQVELLTPLITDILFSSGVGQVHRLERRKEEDSVVTLLMETIDLEASKLISILSFFFSLNSSIFLDLTVFKAELQCC